MKAINKIAAILVLPLLTSVAALAADEGTRYLPTHGKNVTESHPKRAEIKTLSENFVKAMEGKDKKSFSQLVTADLAKTTGWDKDWGKLPTTMSPGLVKIQDFFIMDHKGKLYVRFSVLDRNSQKIHYLPEGTWYRVKDIQGKWKMDAFLPDFSPDSGP